MYTHRSKEKFDYLHVDHINNCWFAWCVGGQKHFSPLETKLYFHVNSSQKDLLY